MIYYDKNTNIIGKIKKVDNSTLSEIPFADISKWSNWTVINNNLYYYKLFNFNELIGEYLCKYLGLDSVHNELVIKDKELYLATKSFIEDGYIYKMAEFDDFDSLLEKCVSKQNRNEIIINHMKLFAIDIYMRQKDREHYSNITYKINKDKYISLAPVYDFSNAFNNNDYYNNVYYDIDFDVYEFNNLFKMYPTLRNELEKLYKLDFYYMLCSILSDYKLKMDDKQLMYYEKKSEKSEKILKRVLY